jgi:cobalt-zinc-cadmium efflux system protein
MAHHHHHHHETDLRSGRLFWAIGINLFLTIAQVLGGLLSGSLSLLADALHNFSDAFSLLIALAARKISLRPSDEKRTYGYGRAEIIGALINSVILVVIGLYLAGQAIHKFFHPNPIDGEVVILIAGLAFLVDFGTTLLTFSASKDNLNIKAAFLHNLADALGSLGVIVSGILILKYDAYFVDAIITFLISVFILFHAFKVVQEAIIILMQSVPADIQVDHIKETLQEVAHVKSAHHIHIWQLNEKRKFLEAHIVLDTEEMFDLKPVKEEIRDKLREHFNIKHSTLEFETLPEYHLVCAKTKH